jgi:Fe-S-cluster containining protein
LWDRGYDLQGMSEVPRSPIPTQSLRDAVAAAACRAEVAAAVAGVYADVRSVVDARRPRCDISGRCCRFEEYGHRLYVTTLELAAFVRDYAGPADPAWDGTGCPFQRSKLCMVHTIRPFGCRMFFCDTTSMEWQNEAYEQFHARLTRLHEELGVPYFYVEWRYALTELGLATANEGER